MNKVLIIITLLIWQISSASADNSQNIAALAQQVKKLDKRLARIESLLNSQILSETVTRIDELQSELQLIRGDVETMNYKVGAATKRNKNLYLDTDRRLQDLEHTSKNIVTAPSISITPVIVPNTPKQKPPTAIAPITKKPTITSPKTVISTQSKTTTKAEKTAYIKAFNYLKQGRYKKSLTAFSQFLQKYPNGRYADNAQYWLAESNYVSRFFKVAIDEFQKVINYYPASPKVSDARLKLGYCYYETGNWQQAKDSFNNLIKDYPSTSVARLAQRRIKRMTQEGH